MNRRTFTKLTGLTLLSPSLFAEKEKIQFNTTTEQITPSVSVEELKHRRFGTQWINCRCEAPQVGQKFILLTTYGRMPQYIIMVAEREEDIPDQSPNFIFGTGFLHCQLRDDYKTFEEWSNVIDNRVKGIYDFETRVHTANTLDISKADWISKNGVIRDFRNCPIHWGIHLNQEAAPKWAKFKDRFWLPIENELPKQLSIQSISIKSI